MDCGIIFYSARKTSFCERALKKSLSALELNLTDALFATKAEGLGKLLIDAFNNCGIAFVIGGLDFGDSRNTAEIISNAAANCSLDAVKRLKNGKGADGYLLKSGNQLLVMLPDEPEQIESIMRGEIADFIKAAIK